MALPNERPESRQLKEIKEAKEASKYLIFKLSGETYGCPLLQIREVVRLPQVKALPQNVGYLKGVVNLRGQVISVMDLRARIGLPVDESPDDLMFVVEANGIVIGMLVDSAESVVELRGTDIEKPISEGLRIPMKFLLGIGKLKEYLVNLLDLQSFVSELSAPVPMKLKKMKYE